MWMLQPTSKGKDTYMPAQKQSCKPFLLENTGTWSYPCQMSVISLSCLNLRNTVLQIC